MHSGKSTGTFWYAVIGVQSYLFLFLFCLARVGNGVEDIPSAATFNVIANDTSPSIISNGIGK
jgi:hypothetical protein